MSRHFIRTLFMLSLLAGMFAPAPRAALHAAEKFTVHEWGTFTTLQDEQGQELPGINVDDEPVPPFVHDLNSNLLPPPVLSSQSWYYRQKGAPRHHPLVTMRLETPVIYFYPGANQKTPLSVDVQVQFRGGWLTQFYPYAKVKAPTTANGSIDFRNLTPQTLSQLSWTKLQVGTSAAGPKTEESVWLAPRKVAAATVSSSAGDGESEKYLFYRGVGRLAAPLRIALDRSRHELSIRGNFGSVLNGSNTANIPAIWLMQTRADGMLAYRTLEGFAASADQERILATASCQFAEQEFSRENRQRLEADMHRAITRDGLYADEATALLSTWQKSYFQSPGLRVFYLVPRVWTDHVLPLTVSGQPRIERVMVGRIELISDEQQELLGKLSRSEISDGKWVQRLVETSPAVNRFLSGHSDFGDLGVPIPADYQLYLQLGRFRNALVTAEEARHPSAALTKFINVYGLHPFRIPTSLPPGQYTGAGQKLIIGRGGETRYHDNLGITHIVIRQDGSLLASFSELLPADPLPLQPSPTGNGTVWSTTRDGRQFRVRAIPFSPELYAFRMEILKDNKVIGGDQQFFAIPKTGS